MLGAAAGVTTARIGRRLSGPLGAGYECLLVDDPDIPDQQATVTSWFLDCPAQSPAWSHYLLSIIHLRPIPGVRPAVIREPHATHEVMVIALDPRGNPHPEDTETWRFLTPVNVCEQVQLPSDADAVELAADCARAVVNGVLWAEPPLSGQKEPWRTVLLKTAAHARGEEHAP